MQAVVSQRLKLSGMRWILPGAADILTLRCMESQRPLGRNLDPGQQPQLSDSDGTTTPGVSLWFSGRVEPVGQGQVGEVACQRREGS